MSNQHQQGQDQIVSIVQSWNQVPLGTKLLFASSMILYVLDLPFGGQITQLFSDVPYLSVHGHIWRVLFCEFVHGSIINLLFSLVTVYFCTVEVENNIGTVRFIIDLLIQNVIIQIVYVAICYLFFWVPQVLFLSSFGLWNIAMLYITMRALSKPDEETQLLCLPVTINNKMYPIAIVLFSNLLSFPRIDIMIAALLGYLQHRFFQGQMIKFSENRINAITNTFLFRKASTRLDFVSYTGRPDIGFQTTSFQVEPVSDNKRDQSTNEFQGKGIEIGSDQFVNSEKQVEPIYHNNTANTQDQHSPNSAAKSLALEGDAQQQQLQQQQRQADKVKNKNYDQLGDEYA